jgi:bacterial/archaeal transporter family-2 protein
MCASGGEKGRERAFSLERSRVAIAGYLLFALVAGAMIPFQAGINAQLAGWVGSPVRAAFVSFVVGTVALGLLSVLILKPLPSASRLGGAPAWIWIGGLFGAFYVLGNIVSAPHLGAATLIAAIVAGQSLASLMIDQYGWVGFREHHVTPGRLVGMALVLTGVALVRLF